MAHPHGITNSNDTLKHVNYLLDGSCEWFAKSKGILEIFAAMVIKRKSGNTIHRKTGFNC